MASTNLAARDTNWRVLDEYSHSDHSYIEYNIEVNAPRAYKEITRRNTRNIDEKKLEIIVLSCEIDIGATANDSAEAFNRALTGILDEVAPRTKVTSKRKSVHWWTPEIKYLRETSNRLRRIYTRKRKRSGDGECISEKEELKKVQLELTKAIKKSKEKSWRELCCMVESDPWGKPYKLVVRILCKKTPIPGIDTPGRVESIIKELFPTHPTRYAVIWPEGEIPIPITDVELKRATKTIK